MVPDYLRTPGAEDALSLSEYGPALGRRFRSLKLWAVLRCHGRSGLQEYIREGVALRHRTVDNERLLHAVNATGEIFISHAVLGGRHVLRLAIGQLATTEADVRRAWELLRDSAAAL
jgi:aromatic-L-amino-acid decarboxylase